MKKIHQSIVIAAPRHVVWAAIINDKKYRIWTQAFGPESHFVGGWQKGETIRFIGATDEGEQMGMMAEIAASDHLRHISIHILGLVKGLQVDYDSEEARQWAPAYEKYYLEPVTDQVTKFTVDVDTNDAFHEEFIELWEAALQKLKDVCEKNLAPFASITVTTDVQAPLEQVWARWTSAESVKKWNHASDDWHCPAASNDLRPGGRYVYTMAARDGSASFDFSGTYIDVIEGQSITSQLDDGRMLKVTFTATGPDSTHVTETFEAENENTLELQRSGWQAILDNFRIEAER